MEKNIDGIEILKVILKTNPLTFLLSKEEVKYFNSF
jgi:hypothetical protein